MAKEISTFFNQKTYAIAASAVISASSPDIPSERVVAYHVDLNITGGNDLSDVTRIKVKAGSQTIWDITPAQLRALVQRFSRSNFPLSATASAFTIPFYHMDLKGEDRYASHFPIGKNATIEINFGAGATAGTARLGWSIVNEFGQTYYKCLGQALNITGAITNASYSLTQKGTLRGLGLVTTNLDKVQLRLAGQNRLDISGRLFRESDQLQNIDTLTDPWITKIHGPGPIVDGDQLLIDAAAGWVAANEGIFYLISPMGSD